MKRDPRMKPPQMPIVFRPDMDVYQGYGWCPIAGDKTGFYSTETGEPWTREEAIADFTQRHGIAPDRCKMGGYYCLIWRDDTGKMQIVETHWFDVVQAWHRGIEKAKAEAAHQN